MKIAEELLAFLKKHSDAEWEYHNPHFLREITDTIESYYQLEDDRVNEWIQEMWGA